MTPPPQLLLVVPLLLLLMPSAHPAAVNRRRPNAYGCDDDPKGRSLFLASDFVEIGIHPAGSFGTDCMPPDSYYSREQAELWHGGVGFVADYARDGFEVGTPPFSGDYFLPGIPEDGWGVQYARDGDDDRPRTFNNFGRERSFDIPQTSLVDTSSPLGDVSSGVWTGERDDLVITQQFSVGKSDLFFVVDVTVENKGAGSVKDFFFFHSVDPDQAEPSTFRLLDDYPFYTVNYVQSNPQSAFSGTIESDRVHPKAPNEALVVALSPCTALPLPRKDESKDVSKDECPAGEDGYKQLTLGLGAYSEHARVNHFGFTNRDPSQVFSDKAWTYYTAAAPHFEDEAVMIGFHYPEISAGASINFKFAVILQVEDLEVALDAADRLTFVSPLGEVSGDKVPFSARLRSNFLDASAADLSVDFSIGDDHFAGTCGLTSPPPCRVAALEGGGLLLSTTFDSTTIPNGRHRFGVRVSSESRSRTAEVSAQRTIDNGGPRVALTSPEPFEFFGSDDAATLTLHADEVNHPDSVRFYVQVGGVQFQQGETLKGGGLGHWSQPLPDVGGASSGRIAVGDTFVVLAQACMSEAAGGKCTVVQRTARKIPDCSTAPNCNAMNRTGCDTASSTRRAYLENTCGPCKSGFTGEKAEVAANLPCSPDCSAAPLALCASRHRAPCSGGNTCGACIAGYKEGAGGGCVPECGDDATKLVCQSNFRRSGCSASVPQQPPGTCGACLGGVRAPEGTLTCVADGRSGGAGAGEKCLTECDDDGRCFTDDAHKVWGGCDCSFGNTVCVAAPLAVTPATAQVCGESIECKPIRIEGGYMGDLVRFYLEEDGASCDKEGLTEYRLETNAMTVSAVAFDKQGRYRVCYQTDRRLLPDAKWKLLEGMSVVVGKACYDSVTVDGGDTKECESDFNRERCSGLADTCGPCRLGYTSDEHPGDANSPCEPVSCGGKFPNAPANAAFSSDTASTCTASSAYSYPPHVCEYRCAAHHTGAKDPVGLRCLFTGKFVSSQSIAISADDALGAMRCRPICDDDHDAKHCAALNRAACDPTAVSGQPPGLCGSCLDGYLEGVGDDHTHADACVVSCTDAPAALYCKDNLNRSPCSDRPNTCGKCLPGFAVSGDGDLDEDRSVRCEVDCSALRTPCAALRRKGCGDGAANTCGKCIDSYFSTEDDDGGGNTLCIPDCDNSPDCAAEQRVSCRDNNGKPNTCGSCLPGLRLEGSTCVVDCRNVPFCGGSLINRKNCSDRGGTCGACLKGHESIPKGLSEVSSNSPCIPLATTTEGKSTIGVAVGASAGGLLLIAAVLMAHYRKGLKSYYNRKKAPIVLDSSATVPEKDHEGLRIRYSDNPLSTVELASRVSRESAMEEARRIVDRKSSEQKAALDAQSADNAKLRARQFEMEREIKRLKQREQMNDEMSPVRTKRSSRSRPRSGSRKKEFAQDIVYGDD